MAGKYCLLTNDVETTSIWHNTLRDETGWKVYREGMPVLLDIYDSFSIKSTFYFTGYIAKLIPDIVKMAQHRGHEVGNHGLSHLKKNGFDVMPFEKQRKHLSEAKKILEDISGEEVISFRAPALRVNKYTARALIETGHKIDSSVASQRFDFFLSFGGFNKLKWLTAPRLPYLTDENDLFKKGNGPIIEVPLSAMIFPYVGTTMRIFPFLTRVQRQFIHWESLINNKPVVFDIHPNEFIDESGNVEGKRKIQRRAKNIVTYILADLIRSRLKAKNLGPKATPLYLQLIQFYKNRNYKITTIKDYCYIHKLI